MLKYWIKHRVLTLQKTLQNWIFIGYFSWKTSWCRNQYLTSVGRESFSSDSLLISRWFLSYLILKSGKSWHLFTIFETNVYPAPWFNISLIGCQILSNVFAYPECETNSAYWSVETTCDTMWKIILVTLSGRLSENEIFTLWQYLKILNPGATIALVYIRF